MATEEEEARTVLGLLNGLAKREYLGQEELSDEFLKEELMADTSEEDFLALLAKIKSLMKVKKNCKNLPYKNQCHCTMRLFIFCTKTNAIALRVLFVYVF